MTGIDDRNKRLPIVIFSLGNIGTVLIRMSNENGRVGASVVHGTCQTTDQVADVEMKEHRMPVGVTL